jgi:hypothetical protein
MKRRVPVLSARLVERIVREVKLGVPSDVAARKFGVPLDTWVAWMTTRRGRTYQDLRAQVDQAEAIAVSDRVRTLSKLGKRGKTRAVQLWLQSRAAEYFPPRTAVNIGVDARTSILNILKDMEALEGKFVDPHLALAGYSGPEAIEMSRLRSEAQTQEYERKAEALEREREQAALPPAETPQPEERAWEVNGETRDGVLEMVSVPSATPARE